MEIEKVPELNLKDICEVHLKVNGELKTVKLKWLTTAQRNQIQSLATKTEVVARQPKVTVDSSIVQIKILFAAIIEAPFPHKNEAEVGKLNPQVADYLYSKYLDAFEPDDKKKENPDSQ